ncbi:hypothetical protein [Stutzerimonas stutzeri]|jgi:hypothetical protein|uniref:hypothetical protein n=1 Tax=Stutzerimonas stutzeri TaxID=316 RepID=UPI001C866A34|nr:hypothetical protein [Stutzerimonas stutzeri]
MDNPYKTPLGANEETPARSLLTKFLLILLATLTAWMLANDVRHLLTVQNDSIMKAAELSIFHYIYIKLAPLPIACFRVFSSVAMLAIIFLAIRNTRLLTRHFFPSIIYGATQVIYAALAIFGVIEILTQIAGRSVMDANFWLAPEVFPSLIPVLFTFVAILAPSILFLATCFSAERISRAQAGN